VNQRPQPDDPKFWRVFFRLQAAYLLLWSVVERYAALRYGPGLRPASGSGILVQIMSSKLL